VNTQHPSNLRG